MRGPTKPLVIVVDDEVPIMLLACEVLDGAHYDTYGLTVSADAFDVIRWLQPALVLLDLRMPGIDGVALYHLLQADQATKAIPVVFFTASPLELEQNLPGYQERGIPVIGKPFRNDDLVAVVRSVLAG